MRRMSALCRTLGTSAVRPSVCVTAVTAKTRSFVAVTRVSKTQFDTHPVGFPPMPPPGVGGRSSTATNAYANDYAPAGVAPGQTQAPPTVEWDARNVNSVVVIGNVGMQPEITEFGNGACVARCTLAVRGKKKASSNSMDGGFMDDAAQNADSSDVESQTTWLDVEAWNDDARVLMEHVTKGKQLQVTGRLKENTWVDKATGQKRSRIKISAYAFAFIAPYAGPGAYGQQNPVDPYGQQNHQYNNNARAAPAQVAYDPYAQQAAVPQQAAPTQNYQQSAPQQSGGEKDDLWRDCVENPDAWWDNRSRKAEPGGNPRYPDFKHKNDQTPLWIESRDTPQWAVDALVNGVGGDAMMGGGDAMAGGSIPQEQQFDPYYAEPAADAAPDYSQPYGEQSAQGYEPAAPFGEEDEPPF